MEKEKKEKIILLILLPVFALGLILKLVGSLRQQKAAPAAVSVAHVAPQATKQIETEPIEPAETTEVKYDAVSLADPLKDKLSFFMASVAPKKKVAETEEAIKLFDTSQLNITGLIWNSARPQAIINGKVVSTGDEINQAKLLSVNRDGITLEYKGVEFFVNKTQKKDK